MRRTTKCTTRSFSSHPFIIASAPLANFCLCLFFFCCFLHFSFIYCFHYLYANYRHLLLSQLHFNDIARKYGNVTVKDCRKHEKLDYKKNKLKLDIDFLNNCKQFGVYPKLLIFKQPNVSNKDALSFHKRLLRSTINKCNKELQHRSKELSLSENVLCTQLSTIDFHILQNL